MSPLLNPVSVGGMCLPNSIVAAPMTKCLADPVTKAPGEAMVQYYSVRKGVFHIAESSAVNHANAYPGTPAIITDEQINGWKKVVEAVHQNGDRIFLQLYHPGMMGRPSLSLGESSQSPSGVAPMRTFVPRSHGEVYQTPAAMTAAEIENVVADFAKAAENADKAGFDGVEIHAASGYLLNTFLAHSTNKREDAYGGTPEKMCRIVLEIIDKIGKTLKTSRVGIRLSPVPLPSMGDAGLSGNLREDPRDRLVYEALLAALNERDIAYVHCSSDQESAHKGFLKERVSSFCKRIFKGPLIAGGGYTIEEAEKRLSKGKCDLVYFGRTILANPRFLQMVKDKTPKEQYTPFDHTMISNPPTT